MGKSGGSPKYASTTSNNPYATGTADKNGSSYTLNPFLNQTNKFVESNMPSLYNQLLNPSLNNPVTQARSELFYNQFNKDSNKAFENNLINPLIERNMVRSSAMNDLSNQFMQNQNENISNFNNQLISNNLSDTSSLISQLMNLYLQGANLGQQAISNAKGDAQMINNYNLQSNAMEQANKNNMWGNISNIGSSALMSAGTAAAAL